MGGKGLLKILLNTAKPPIGELEIEQRDHLEHRTKSVLYNALDGQHFAAVIHCKTANQIWITLLAQESASANNKFILKRELANFKYQDGSPIAEYTAGINLRVANLGAAGVNVDDDIMMKIINELPRRYDSFINTFELSARNTQMKLSDFLELLHDADHRLRKHRYNKNDTLMANKHPITCYNCGKKGHTNAECRKNNKKTARDEFSK